jgi:putative hydrolase of the HAD superfamily
VKEIRAITFDAGGTLLYPYPSVGEIYSEVMRGHGLSLKGEVLDRAFRVAWKEAHSKPRVGISVHDEKTWWRDLVRRTLRDLGKPSDFEALFEELWHTFAKPHRWKLHDGAMETISVLKKRGYRLAILSNWDPRLRILLEGFGLAGLFDEMIISSEVGSEKPDERIFRIVEERLKLKPQDLLHVGDSQFHDWEGATRVGWNCLLVTHSDSDEKVPEGRVSRLPKLLDLLP